MSRTTYTCSVGRYIASAYTDCMGRYRWYVATAHGEYQDGGKSATLRDAVADAVTCAADFAAESEVAA